MDPFDIERITGALATAALHREQWPAAMDIVAQSTRSRGAVLLPVVGPMPFLFISASTEQLTEDYIRDGWIDRDERYLGLQSFLRSGVFTDDDCMPAEQRKRSPYYQELIYRNGFGGCAGVRVGRGETVWNLGIQRTFAQGDFSRDELSSLATLSASLDSVAEVSVALDAAKGAAALEAFEFSDRAAVLLNRTGTVVRANRAAEAMIGPDLLISHGRVRSNNPLATKQFDHAIKTLLWTKVASVVPPVMFPKLEGGHLVIYPMRLRGITDSPLSTFHAILVIIDTQTRPVPLAGTLRALFDLTAAEARLAIAIANGLDLTSFAAKARVSKETARSQLKAIFDKTGTSRQADLVAILGALLPKK